MGEEDLPQTTVFELMDIGYNFAKIGQIRKGRKLGPTRRDPLGMVQRMQDFCVAVEELGLSKSTRLARKLLKGRLAQLERAVENYAEAPLYDRTAEELRDKLNTLWERVCDEASRQDVYIVRSLAWEAPLRDFVESPREALGLELAYNPELPRELDENLEEVARYVRFRLMGGVVFFMLRAVEVVLKLYYESTTGEDTNRAWGRLCASMDDPNCEVPSHLVEEIRQLKERYRDPTMHVTEVELEWDGMTAVQAQSLCRALVTHMMAHLEETGEIEALTPSPNELEFNGE